MGSVLKSWIPKVIVLRCTPRRTYDTRSFQFDRNAEPFASVNRYGRCGCNPRRESAAAQLFSSGNMKSIITAGFLTRLLIIMLSGMFVYVASYGPAWSIASRTGCYGILDAYVLLPVPLKREYVFMWAKLDGKVKTAVFK
jgi:hypothetical protein